MEEKKRESEFYYDPRPELQIKHIINKIKTKQDENWWWIHQWTNESIRNFTRSVTEFGCVQGNSIILI